MLLLGELLQTAKASAEIRALTLRWHIGLVRSGWIVSIAVGVFGAGDGGGDGGGW